MAKGAEDPPRATKPEKVDKSEVEQGPVIQGEFSLVEGATSEAGDNAESEPSLRKAPEKANEDLKPRPVRTKDEKSTPPEIATQETYRSGERTYLGLEQEETRREYYSRLRKSLEANISELEDQAKTDPEKEKELALQKEKLEDVIARAQKRRMKDVPVESKVDAEERRDTVTFNNRWDKRELDRERRTYETYQNALEENLSAKKSAQPRNSENLPVRSPHEDEIEDVEFSPLAITDQREEARVNPNLTLIEEQKRIGYDKGLESANEAGPKLSKLDDAKATAEKLQSEYLSQLKAFNKSRSGLSVAADNFTGERMPSELKKLRREWVRSRAAFARAQKESVAERLSGRERSREEVLDGLKKYKGKGSLDEAEIAARYERMVTVRTTILGAEESEQQARIDGLSERDKGRFDKAMDWYKRQPAWARIAGTSALMFGGAAAITTLAGAGVGIAALGLGGARAGAQILAAGKAGAASGTWATIAAGLAGAAGIAGLAAEAIVRGGHDILGTKDKAQDLLAKKQGFGDLSDEKNFERISASRKKALGADESVKRQGRFARTVASLTGGFLFGQALNGSGGADDVVNNDANSAAGDAPVSGTESKVPSTNESGAAAGATEAPDIRQDSLAIGGNINNADRLVGHFRDQLEKEYPNLETAPPAIRTLIEHGGTQDELTKWLNLQDADGTSVMVHEGNTISISETGELVLTTNKGSYTLIDSNGTAQRFDLDAAPTTENPLNQPASAASGSDAGAAAAETQPAAQEAAGIAASTASDEASDAATDIPTGVPSGTASDSTAEAGAQTEASSPEAIPNDQAGAHSVSELNSSESVVVNSASAAQQIDTAGAHSVDELTQGDGSENLNSHGVEVLTNATHEYRWTPAGAESTSLVAFGGTPEAASVMARTFAETNPAGSTMLFVREERDLLGLLTSKHVDAWTKNPDGTLTLIKDVTAADGTRVSIPDPRDFTQRIK